MSKVLVLYYSTYGHIEKLADAVAAGARETGAAVDIKRVRETAPEAVAKAAHFKLDQKALILHDADAIIRSSPSSRSVASTPSLSGRTDTTSVEGTNGPLRPRATNATYHWRIISLSVPAAATAASVATASRSTWVAPWCSEADVDPIRLVSSGISRLPSGRRLAPNACHRGGSDGESATPGPGSTYW